MHRTQHRRLRTVREFLRHLTPGQLSQIAGGMERPTCHQCGPCAIVAVRGTTSEAEGAGPCPGEYSWTCQTG